VARTTTHRAYYYLSLDSRIIIYMYYYNRSTAPLKIGQNYIHTHCTRPLCPPLIMIASAQWSPVVPSPKATAIRPLHLHPPIFDLILPHRARPSIIILSSSMLPPCFAVHAHVAVVVFRDPRMVFPRRTLVAPMRDVPRPRYTSSATLCRPKQWGPQEPILHSAITHNVYTNVFFFQYSLNFFFGLSKNIAHFRYYEHIMALYYITRNEVTRALIVVSKF